MLKLSDRYDLWKVTYMTYEELAVFGPTHQELVERNLSYEQGLEKLKSLPFNYCIKPSV